jgi:SNF2 family DNA or RNA helicase
VQESAFGKEVYGSRNVEQFKKVLTQYALIKTKKQLGLQKKFRDILPVEMTSEQESAYKSIKDDMILEIESIAGESTPLVSLNTLSSWNQLRKLLCCPAIIHPSLGCGGGLLEIVSQLASLSRTERHCVIFVPFRDAVKTVAHFLRTMFAEKLGTPIYELMGGVEADELYNICNEFKARAGIIVCTVDYAESFDLETADKCFFLGASWDPQTNMQAEDRLDRLTNAHGIINCYYVMYEDCAIDEKHMMSLTSKQASVNLLYDKREVLKAL